MGMHHPLANGLWHSAVSTFQDWRRRRAAVNEIAALDRKEAEKVLGECGLTQAEFTEAMRHTFASSILLPEAMQSVGVDPVAFEKANAEWNQDLRRTCMLCARRSHCSNLLASSEFANRYHSFCPNSASFDEMKKLGADAAAA
ncbi:hypothetical protein [Mesorhizobium sp. ANAO-SY3R2]|uniref:hypothetical protein n=1 Tax=Mesorhizobium sp. ANAO-SY3R2 TaxID=3166644 RepID=UPI003671AF08